MAFSLITGPGNHSAQLIQALKSNFEFDYAEYWPQYRFTHYSRSSQTEERSRFFDLVTRLVYGVRNKTRFISRSKWHHDVIYDLYDQLNRRKIRHGNLLAWPQMSLSTMRKVKQNGGVTIMDQPMCHVDFWNTIAAVEHRKWGMQNTARFTARTTRKLKTEYEVADFLLVPSSFSRRTFEENGIPKHKLIDCPYGVQIPNIGKNDSCNQKRIKVIYVGRIELLKGIHYLIEAAARLSNHVSLHLVGHLDKGMGQFLRGHEGFVVSHGQVSRSELAAIYKTADVLVFPSLYDSFGLAILEAMSYGVPVISTMHSAGPDVIIDGVNGFVVAPGSVEAIERQLVWMIQNPAARIELGRQGRQTVEQRYTLESYHQRVCRIVGAHLASSVNPPV